MFTPEQLRKLDVLEWTDLRRQFDGADLLLGNGFSMKLAPQLGYKSLFERFLSRCDADQTALFQGLDTTNFEELQRVLLNAKRVAELLGTPLARIDDYVNALREGLILAIHENHPKAADIDKARLTRLSEQLDGFNDIFTTNYDLFIYHIIMISKDRHRENASIRPYNDYFWSRYSEEFLQFMGYQNYKMYKHVYYMHGALFIFPATAVGHHSDLKLRRGDDWELLDSIDGLIRRGILPLFVSEGTAPQKIRTISQSRYLRFAVDRLEEAKESLVVYGFSFGNADRHILDSIGATRRSLAVSLYVGDKKLEQITAEVAEVRGKLKPHDVVVFNSTGLFE